MAHERPPASESSQEEGHEGGQRKQESDSTKAVPAGTERGRHLGGDRLQPRRLSAVCAHAVP
jgi:hypothetical protein